MAKTKLIPEHLRIDSEKVSQKLAAFIQNSVKSSKTKGVIIGLSGGLDSSTVLALAATTFPPHKILGLIMPERDSSLDSESDAKLIAKITGIKYDRVELTPILDKMGIYQHIPKVIFSQKNLAGAAVMGGYKLYTKLTGERPFLSGLKGTNFGLIKRTNAYYRMKHRLRRTILYSYAERENLLVMGTINKTEYLTGFFVRYGDNAADIMPLINLYKTQVWLLAKFLRIPDKIINKAPSPDLIPGITDEFAIGISYEKLDLILSELSRNETIQDIATISNTKPKTIEYVKELVKRSEYMRIMPYIPSD
ncbi:MAG: NAD(+) synthase [Dehalococcoidales bacterium]|nr:NAD(+) synthase [Dehalococcoidales bacterium]